jgi:hypothetical protein
MDRSGFSGDGYIIDQSKMGRFPYGKFASDYNGCGWIAVYNLMHALGFAVTAEQIHKLCLQALPYKGFFGTPVKTVCQVLDLFAIRTETIRGRKQILSAPNRYAYGILRFFDGKYDHYVAFADAGSGMYRFFNSDPSREVDVLTMERFVRQRCRLGPVTCVGVTAHP